LFKHILPLNETVIIIFYHNCICTNNRFFALVGHNGAGVAGTDSEKSAERQGGDDSPFDLAQCPVNAGAPYIEEDCPRFQIKARGAAMVCEGACERDRSEKRQTGFLKKVIEKCLNAGGWNTSGKASSAALRVLEPGGKVILKGELGVLQLSGRGMITCTDGVAWVTYPGRFCDYLIREGESLILRGDAKVVISGGSNSVGVRVRRW
jgi:hypothetical protein